MTRAPPDSGGSGGSSDCAAVTDVILRWKSLGLESSPVSVFSVLDAEHPPCSKRPMTFVHGQNCASRPGPCGGLSSLEYGSPLTPEEICLFAPQIVFYRLRILLFARDICTVVVGRQGLGFLISILCPPEGPVSAFRVRLHERTPRKAPRLATKLSCL